jgi:uncharacterized membrane protein
MVLILRNSVADVHPPFYYLVLKLFKFMFGDSIFVMKLTSVLPVVLTMIFMTIFLKKEFSDKAVILFLLCFTVSESIVYYSIEIRMYSWGLFFITMAALSAWYIITTGKITWWLVFLLCAEGAAYTQYYAAILAAIGYLLLSLYIIKHDRKQILKVVTVGAAAVLLYLPWLPVLVSQFTGIANDWWLKSITLSSVVGWVVTVFSVGNKIVTLLFFILFCAVFVHFCTKKHKTVKDWFAFGSLCSIIMFAVFGILISVLIRPLFIARYLIPACGLVWLFFAIECSTVSNKRIFAFVCTTLVSFGILSFSTSFYKERRENKDFEQFYTYLSENIHQDDIFIFPPKYKQGVHLSGITAYLFPNHSYVIDFPFIKLLDNTLIPYNESHERAGWILISENDNNGMPTDIIIPTDADTELHGIFGWGGYKFKLYYTKSSAIDWAARR